VCEKWDIIDPLHRRNRGTATNVDENFAGFEDFIIDHDRPGRLKASMALDDRTIFKSSQPLLYASGRLSADFIFARLNTFHIDAHLTIDLKAVFGAAASNMGRVRTGNERLCRYTSCI